MLSRPIASGAMLAVLLGAMGGAIFQQGDLLAEAGVADIEIADVSTPEPAEAEAPAPETPSPATAPGRVVDSAGFPVVPEVPEDEEEAAPAGPVVTVNGRPLGGSATPTPPASTPAAPPRQTPATPEAEDAAPEAGDTQVAVVPPPTPQPRPEGLEVRPNERVVDYEAIAEAAYGTPSGEFMSREERSSLAPLPGGNQTGAVYDPRQDELVGIVGPNGEVIWVYEDQVRSPNSRVTFQGWQQNAPPSNNPFGFVYD